MLQNVQGKAVGVQESEAVRIATQAAHEDGRVVSPTQRSQLFYKIFLVLISVREWVDLTATVRPEGSCQWNIPVTPSGIEAAGLWRSASTNCATVCIGTERTVMKYK
jgi:hypothetical protein